MSNIDELTNAVIGLTEIMQEMNNGHHETAQKTIAVLETMNRRIAELEAKINPNVYVNVYNGEDDYLWVDVYVNGKQTEHYTKDVSSCG